jgi:hypothetical protein
MAPRMWLFLWRAICSVSNRQWPVRRAEPPGAPAPDSSSPSGARPLRRARGDSIPQSAPESPPRCDARSTTRWEPHGHGPPAVTAGATARIAERSTSRADRALPWGPRRLRLRSARPATIDAPNFPRPVPGAPLRSSLCLPPAGRQHGAGVFPMSWVFHKVSCYGK